MQVMRLLSEKGDSLVSVAPTDTVAEVTKLFGPKRAGMTVVCNDDGRIAGVVSLGDIAHAIGERGAEALDLPVRVIMTLEVVTCKPNDEIETAVQRMTILGVRHLPVVDEDGRAIALVQKREALEMLYELQALDFQQLRNYVFKTGGRY